MAKITIDGKPYTVKDGITIIEALDQNGIDLPRYCYHPGLSIAGNCRICQVEVEKTPKAVIACNTRVADGMVIWTKSEKAKESQKLVLEFLLANHPLDCPVCDQAGECKLQDYYMDYGVYDPRFNENKVKKKKKAFPIGPTILLDQERCILCSRCVRFTDEITKTHEFGIFHRGDHSEIDLYPGCELKNPYSGNVADICPVGALTDRDFRFKIRVWYLGSQKSICPGCARGCSIFIDYEKSRPYPLKDARVMRLRPRENPQVNRWWICDEGRYGYKPIDERRVREVKIRRNGTLQAADWEEAVQEISRILVESKKNPDRWAFIGSPQYTNEELYLQRRLFMDHLGWKHFGFSWKFDQGSEDDFLMKADKNPNSEGARRLFGLKSLPDILELLQKVHPGDFEGVYVVLRDLSHLGEEALSGLRRNVKTIICEAQNENGFLSHADFVLPSSAYAEKEGTFTNFEGRVQRIWKAVEALKDSQPAWKILGELARRSGVSLDFQHPEEIFEDLAKNHRAFQGLSYAALEPYGAMLKNA